MKKATGIGGVVLIVLESVGGWMISEYRYLDKKVAVECVDRAKRDRCVERLEADRRLYYPLGIALCVIGSALLVLRILWACCTVEIVREEPKAEPKADAEAPAAGPGVAS
jgi:hypothetical protein